MVRIAAIICAFIIYIPFFGLTSDSGLKCLVETSKINSISGKIISNPVKSSFKDGTYKALFLCNIVNSNSQTSESTGIISVYIPCAIVEKHYPGKLYTSVNEGAGHKAVLIENGSNLICNGRFFKNKNDQVFFAQQVDFLGFDNTLWGSVQKIRGLCRLQFKRLMYGWGNAGGFLLALLSGSREYTEKTVSDGFINSGLAHIIALSGMHLSLFGGIALLFGQKITTRRLASGIQLGAVLFFVWFAGGSPSLIRALICSLVMFIVNLFRMAKPEQLDILCFSFLVQAFFFPAHLFESAFLLSYFALAGILIITPHVKNFFSRRLFPYITNNFCTGLGAQIMTLPVSAVMFSRIIPAGIIASVVISPLVTVFIYCGLSFILMNLMLPFLNPLFNGIINLIYEIIKVMVSFFAGFPSINF